MQFDTASPIWTQLVAEFARRIVVGEWAAGERLPGVRDLATDLGVNPNTAQRALAELERQGLCHSERTAGRYVTDNTERIDTLRSDLAQSAADEFVSRARGFRLTTNQAQELIAMRWGSHDRNDDNEPDEQEEPRGS